LAVELTDLETLARGDEGDADAFAARASSSPDAM